MRKFLSAFIILSLLIFQACGGTNHWDNLSSAESTTRNEVYVSKSGDDTLGDGSPQMPYASITKGISDASARGYGIVRVAQGLYSENVSLIEGVSLYGGYDPSTWTRDIVTYPAEIDGGAGSAIIADGLISPITRATVVDGFTLLTPGAGVGVVTISNSSPSITNNIIDAFDFGVQCTNSSAVISNNTIYSGNTGIECNTGSDTISNNTINLTNIGINCNTSSGTIRNNTITSNTMGIQCVTTGGYITGNTINSNDRGINITTASTVTVQYNTIIGTNVGISSDQSAATICYNTVTSDTGFTIDINQTAVNVYGNLITGGNVGNTYGIRNTNANSRIYNNVIFGGSGTISRAIECLGASTPEIYNNTIDGGTATNESYGISMLTSSPRISNNIIYISGSPILAGIGVWERDAGSDPLELRNNNIFNCTLALYRDEGATNRTTDIQLNDFNLTTQNGAASSVDNVVVILTFGANQRITGALPPADLILVTEGGLDGMMQSPPWSFTFSIDRDRVTRTAQWSMGAYEY